MYRKFIATISAAAIALTALGAAPAHADNDDDLARALAAVLGVAVIGSIIHDNKKKKRARHQSTYQDHQPAYQPPRPRYTQPHVQPRTYTQPHVQPRPLPRNVRRNLLPGQCLRSFDTRKGRVRMFPQRCLENNYRQVNRLPQHCATRIKTNRGVRRGFEAHCLRQAGYRLAHG